MVSKRLDKWRRDISEKRRKRKSKRYYIPMKLFNSKPPQKRMAKLKCSTYLPHIFSTFSSVFLWIFHMSKTQTVSITGRRMFASTLGRAKLFTPMNSSSAKIRESVARLLRQPIHGFGCVAHKRIYSQWLQRYMMPSVFFVATPERNATATRKEALWWDKRLTSSENTALRELILHPPWTPTYSLRMFSIGS